MRLGYFHGVFSMASRPSCSSTWINTVGIAILIFTSSINANLSIDYSPSLSSSSSLYSARQSVPSSGHISTPTTYPSSSQHISDIVSTLSYSSTSTSSALPGSTKLLTSSISLSQDVAMPTSTKDSSPGVDTSSFITPTPSTSPSSSYNVYVTSSQSSADFLMSSLPSSGVSATDTVLPSLSSQTSGSSTRTSTSWHSTTAVSAITSSISSSYMSSSSGMTISSNAATSTASLQPSAYMSSSSSSISTDAATSTAYSLSSSSNVLHSTLSSSLSESTTSVLSSFVITPSPSIQQTSIISTTPAVLPNMSSPVSSVPGSSTRFPGIASSSLVSTPKVTSVILSKSSSVLFSSSITGVRTSSSSATMSTSIPVLPTTPPIQGPSAPPQNVTVHDIASTSMVVSWQPPTPGSLHGELQKYEVQLEKVALDACSSSSVPSKTATTTSTILATSTLSSALLNSTTKLQTSSHAGQSSASMSNSMYSSTIQTTAESSNTIMPTTMPVEPTKPTEPPPEPPLPVTDGLINAHTNLSIRLSNLEAFTCYGIKVRAVTTHDGPWSATLLVRTTHDKPTAPPSGVTAATLSSTSILVSWKPPPLQNRHGLIKHYMVEYYSNRDDLHVNNTMDNTTSITLIALLPYTQYYVKVKAVNRFGAGPASEPVSNTTFEGVPSPPTNFTVKSVNATALFASWDPPLNPNGAFIKYRLYYRQTAFNVSTNVLAYNGQATMFVITDLEKFTNYTVTLFAYNVMYGYNSTGEHAVENTHPSVPTEPTDVQTNAINSTSIYVSWKPPNELNGLLSYYKVSYKPSYSPSIPPYVNTGLSSSVILTSLQPYTEYIIYVQAATTKGLGPPSTVLVSTKEGVPGVISYLAPYSVTTESITIKWAPPLHRNGKIGYKLVYGSTVMPKNLTKEFDDGSTMEKFVYLVSYTNYTFMMSAYNLGSGQHGPWKSITVRTLPMKSSPPRNIRLVSSTANSLSIAWDPPAHPYGEILYYRLQVYDAKNGLSLKNRKVFGVTFRVDLLEPYHEYKVLVSCQNNADESDSSQMIFRTLPTVPPAIPPIKQPNERGITENEIVIELEEASDSNGKISYYQVIVLELAVDSAGDVITPDDKPDDFTPNHLFTYEEARLQKPRLVPYIAAQFPADLFSTFRHFKVGDGKNFSTKARKQRAASEQYYNGPLKPSTFYTMFQRAAVSKDIYRSTGWTVPVSTSEKAVASKKQSKPSTNVGLVAGVCVTLLFLIVVAIILVMFLWKKRRFAFGMMLDDEGDYSNKSFKLQKIRGSKRRRTSSRGLMGSTDSLDNLDNLTRRRQPIPVEEFVGHVQRMHIDGDIGFSEEYELVQPDDKEFTWQHSLMPVNKHKNRYANIVSYDHSRVLLAPIEGVAGSDYINANYIDGYSRSGAYIATQGPLPETFDDFWRMIWEQGTATVVMLTQLEERGRRKCDQYWPDRGTHTYGAIRVTASEISHMSYYVLRVFLISHKQDEEEPRQVRQYHFTSWPDHGVPTHPVPLLSLVRTVANANPSTAGPCIVHCSAGVGRTGTYITLDSVLQRIEKEQTIDVFEFVQQMRMKRNLMVQTESQYIFIHDALVEAVSCGITEFEAKKCATRIRELREVHPDTGRTNMEQEFLRLLKDERHHSTFKAANMGVNSAKNRYLNILPYENTRVPLKMRPGEVGSDYINASYIDGYCCRRAYIATQAPLPGTFEDYWRMVWEQGSCVIVMLTREEEAGKVKCHRYWPSDGTRIFGDVLVELTEEVSYTDYIMRQFNLTHTEEKDSRVVRQYQYIGWPDVGLPESGVGLIDLIGQVEKWQQQSNNSIITAHCSGGVGRTGVFSAISILIERVKAEGVIDVFQTVQLLRLQRPAMVQILEQYEFCYSTLQEYLESFDLYANFN